nr:(13S,14R)-1,13-dihydroxy-N-methylcanadine 13-O-acetyltransferase AT1-like [Ziziphus jujuba var. spinosa]
MATDMNIVEVILREIVKPSSPTPHHFKTHELCFIDHSVPLMYFPLLLFYSHDNSIHDSRSVGGKDQPSNDKDLEKPDIQLLRQFLAAEPESQGARISPLLLVQATFFECGGMAIGLSVLHNAMDAASLTTSLNKNDEIDLKILVAKLGEVMEQTNNDIESYCCSSWCSHSFYNADSGWGKPACVSISGVGFKNFVFLLSTRNGDGIKAWLTLGEDKKLVERNQ